MRRWISKCGRYNPRKRFFNGSEGAKFAKKVKVLMKNEDHQFGEYLFSILSFAFHLSPDPSPPGGEGSRWFLSPMMGERLGERVGALGIFAFDRRF